MKRSKLIIIVSCLLFVCMTTAAFGQLLKIDLGINGLTCSQCSRSVEMQLRKLSFVESVHMDLEQTKAEVKVFKDKKVDWEAIAKAVRNGGFSVRYLNVSFDATNLDFSTTCFTFQNNAFHFIQPFEKSKKGIIQLQLIAEDFLPKRALSQYQLNQSQFCKGKHLYFVEEISIS